MVIRLLVVGALNEPQKAFISQKEDRQVDNQMVIHVKPNSLAL